MPGTHIFFPRTVYRKLKLHPARPRPGGVHLPSEGGMARGALPPVGCVAYVSWGSWGLTEQK